MTGLPSDSRVVFALIVAAFIVVARPIDASATPVTVLVGTFSFDQLVPSDDGAPGTNAFTIWNLTGPDFAIDGDLIVPALPLLDVVATLVPGSGGPDITEPLGTITSGPFVDGSGFPPTSLQFSALASFVTATLTGRIAGFTTTLADGTVLAVADMLFTASLNPSDGVLLAGRDLVDISITADRSAPSSVPEPATLILLGAGLAAGGVRRVISRS